MDKSAYIQRISQANPVQLVVINLEIILDFLTVARESLGVPEGGFTEDIAKAKAALEQLIDSLDFNVSLSHDFYNLYKYIFQLLCDAEFSSDKNSASDKLSEANDIVSALLKGWREAEANNADMPPVAQDAPKIYAGLTYGRDGTANEYVDTDNGRGYMA